MLLILTLLNMKCVRILYKDPDSCGTLKLMLTLPASFLYCFFFDMITNLVVLFPSSFTSRFKISSPHLCSTFTADCSFHRLIIICYFLCADRCICNFYLIPVWMFIQESFTLHQSLWMRIYFFNLI